MKQTSILVLGMHRSGTSALAGMLSLLDVYLGSDLMPANAGNEKGYFENNRLYKINKALLSKINSSWDDEFFDEGKLENIKEVQELKETLQGEFEYSNVFAIKDPRLAYLFPIYEKVLKSLNVDMKIIIPYRNPIEVAFSLKHRNEIPIEKGMLLWGYNFLLSEKFSRKYERIFVFYDELMSNPKKTIFEISSKINIDFNSRYEDKKELIEDFLEPNLKHHNISIINLSRNTPKIVTDILQLRERFNDTDLTKEFDSLRHELFDYKKLFYNDSVINSLDSGQRASSLLVQREGQIALLEQQVLAKEDEHKSQIATLEQQVLAKEDEHKSQIATLEQQILAKEDEHKSQVATLEQQVLAKEDEHKSQVDTLAQDQKVLVEERQALENKLNDRFKELAILTRMLEERDHNPAGKTVVTQPKNKIIATSKKAQSKGLLWKIKYELFTLRRQRKLVEKSGLFDKDWYLNQYPDVAEDGVNPIEHYIRYGAAEERDPGPDFNGAWYLRTYPDVSETGMNPLVHYVQYGKAEGRIVR